MSQESISYFIQLIVSGLSQGAIYAIIALGFVLIYKSTRILNFAQGDLMMVGSYLWFALVVQCRIPFLLALPIVLILSVLLGAVIEKFVTRPMIGEPIFSVVMITIGMSTVFSGITPIIWGHQTEKIPSPFFEHIWLIKGVLCQSVQVYTVIITIIVFILFFLFFWFSWMGIAMRAAADNQDIALLMGIDVMIVARLSWIIGCVVATIGGILFASMYNIYPSMNFVGIRAFPAAILGGLDSVPGAILGGIFVGLIESFAGGYIDEFFGGGIKEITAFVILIFLLMIKPYGFFGQKEIERV